MGTRHVFTSPVRGSSRPYMSLCCTVNQTSPAEPARHPGSQSNVHARDESRRAAVDDPLVPKRLLDEPVGASDEPCIAEYAAECPEHEQLVAEAPARDVRSRADADVRASPRRMLPWQRDADGEIQHAGDVRVELRTRARGLDRTGRIVGLL